MQLVLSMFSVLFLRDFVDYYASCSIVGKNAVLPVVRLHVSAKCCGNIATISEESHTSFKIR